MQTSKQGKTVTVMAVILKSRRPVHADALSNGNEHQPQSPWAGEASGKCKVEIEDEDTIDPKQFAAVLRNKRFRFSLSANSTADAVHAFTWSPTWLVAPTSQTHVSSSSPKASLASFSSPSSAQRSAAESGGSRRSTRSTSFMTPLFRRSRAVDNGHAPLFLSSSTLIVVPATLVDHWKFQISAHTREGVLRVLAISKHSDILPAAQMAQYDVVLTTFDLLSKEWAISSPAPGSDRWYKMHGTVGQGTQSWRVSLAGYKGVAHEAQHRLASPSASAAAESSEFLQVHWQRVVLDEGHVMGASSDTNRALMLSSIVAGAKWICTGTPTPSTPAAELQHMYARIFACLFLLVHDVAIDKNYLHKLTDLNRHLTDLNRLYRMLVKVC